MDKTLHQIRLMGENPLFKPLFRFSAVFLLGYSNLVFNGRKNNSTNNNSFKAANLNQPNNSVKQCNTCNLSLIFIRLGTFLIP